MKQFEALTQSYTKKGGANVQDVSSEDSLGGVYISRKQAAKKKKTGTIKHKTLRAKLRLKSRGK